MATETLYAASVLSGTLATSANSLGATDTVFTTDTGNTSWTVRWEMGNPTGNQANGNHTVRVRCRKTPGQTGTPVLNTIAFYSSGTLVTGSTVTLNATVSSGTGQDVDAVIDSAVLAGLDLSTIEVQVATTGAGGSGTARCAVQVDSVSWSGDFTVAKQGSITGGYAYAPVTAGITTRVGTATGTHVYTGTAVAALTSGWSSSIQVTTHAAGAATGTYDDSGSATGTFPAAGSSTSTYDASGSATGVFPASGAATGADDFTGSSTGAMAPVGTSAGSYDNTGDATGTRAPVGEATAGFLYTGLGSSGSTRQGSAGGSYAYDGTTSGARDSLGSAGAGYASNPSATGVRESAGAATGDLTYTELATALFTRYGSSTSAYTYDGTASGVRVSSGEATGEVDYTGDAQAPLSSSSGSVTGEVSWAGDATSVMARNITITAVTEPVVTASTTPPQGGIYLLIEPIPDTTTVGSLESLWATAVPYLITEAIEPVPAEWTGASPENGWETGVPANDLSTTAPEL